MSTAAETMSESKSIGDSLGYENIAMENSVLGDETMASLEGRGYGDSNSLLGKVFPYFYRSEPNSYGVEAPDHDAGDTSTEEAELPTDMAILGDVEDVSTIAGDTIGGGSRSGSITKVFPSISIRKKDVREKGNQEDSDDEDAAERYQSKYSGEYDGEKTAFEEDSCCSRAKYYWAAFVAAFLIGTIAALALGFTALNDPDSDSSEADLDWDWTFKPTQAATPSPTISSQPSMTPSTPMPTSSQAPTQTPTFSPTLTEEANFTSILSEVSASSIDDIEKPESSQHRAFKWITSDPDYFSYSKNRIIQRWVLAVFSLELSATSGNRRLIGAFDDWMKYTDECSWFSTDSQINACDETGSFKSLVLQGVGLDGTIPSELLLLDQLQTLILSKNIISGTIPEDLDRLSNLKVLDLNKNHLGGSIPDSIGDMVLDDIDLGNNYLQGKIPRSIGNAEGLTRLSLIGNSLTGSIPSEVGQLKFVETLDLRNNRLTGTLPPEIWDLSNLQELELIQNELTGTIPTIVCFSLKNLEVLSADCSDTGSVECECCNCNDGVTSAPSVTPPPTPSPTASVPPSLSTTLDPTPYPTPEPTRCRNTVDVSKSCFERGEDIRVNFVNCDAENDDWVGLYDSDENPSRLGNPLLWLWNCGTRSCSGGGTRGTVYLDDTSESGSDWPVSQGTYKVFMARNDGSPYESIGESREIRIANSC